MPSLTRASVHGYLSFMGHYANGWVEVVGVRVTLPSAHTDPVPPPRPPPASPPGSRLLAAGDGFGIGSNRSCCFFADTQGGAGTTKAGVEAGRWLCKEG
jgi:hypothetical protein